MKTLQFLLCVDVFIILLNLYKTTDDPEKGNHKIKSIILTVVMIYYNSFANIIKYR